MSRLQTCIDLNCDVGEGSTPEELDVERQVLRQVTSAIRQDGANQVGLIKSTAERKAAVEFAKAAAIRPKIVGDALRKVAADQDVAKALFDVLEVQRIGESEAKVTLIPRDNVLAQLITSGR